MFQLKRCPDKALLDTNSEDNRFVYEMKNQTIIKGLGTGTDRFATKSSPVYSHMIRKKNFHCLSVVRPGHQSWHIE